MLKDRSSYLQLLRGFKKAMGLKMTNHNNRWLCKHRKSYLYALERTPSIQEVRRPPVCIVASGRVFQFYIEQVAMAFSFFPFAFVFLCFISCKGILLPFL